MITELRRYRIKPEMAESWISFFREAAAENERRGIRVEYAGFDAETGTFIWLRSFADETDRRARKDAFYGADWWLEREKFAMGHVTEYDVTFLDAVIVRQGGELIHPHWPADGEAAGSRLDGRAPGLQTDTRKPRQGCLLGNVSPFARGCRRNSQF